MPDPSTTTTVTTADPLPPGPGDGRDRVIAELTEDVIYFRAHRDEAQRENAKLQADVAERDKSIGAMRRIAEGNQAFVNRVIRERDEANAMLATLRAQVSGFHEEIDKMRAKEFDLCSTITTLRSRLARAEAIEAKAKAAWRAWMVGTSLKDCHQEMCSLSDAIAVPAHAAPAGDRAERCECCLRFNCYNMQCPRCVERHNNVAIDSGDRAERERGDHSRPHCTHEAALEEATKTIAELREQVVAKHDAANRVISSLRSQFAAVAERERRHKRVNIAIEEVLYSWSHIDSRDRMIPALQELEAAHQGLFAAYQPTPEPGADFGDFLLRRRSRRENFERSQTPEARRQAAERLAGLHGEGTGQREVGDE